MSFDNVGRMTSDDFDAVTALMEAEDNGSNPFNLHIRTQEEIDADSAAESLRTAVNDAVVVKKVGSKKEQAVAIYLGLEDKSRKSVIEALVSAGFKKATSSTYQAQMKNWIS